MKKFISYKSAKDYLSEIGYWDKPDAKYENMSVFDIVNLANSLTNQEADIQALLEKMTKHNDSKPIDEQPSVTISKIVVPTEFDKQQLLLAFEYIHKSKNIDTTFSGVNTVAHVYEHPELIEVDNEK